MEIICMRSTLGYDNTVSLFNEGYESEEIASILNKPIATVRRWLQKHYDNLKNPTSPVTLEYVERYRARVVEREVKKKKGYYVPGNDPNSNLYRVTEIGIEKLCTKCGEYWPADTEFFHLSDTYYGDGLYVYCKACSLEKRREQKL
jgi:hypothetical protein